MKMSIKINDCCRELQLLQGWLMIFESVYIRRIKLFSPINTDAHLIVKQFC